MIVAPYQSDLFQQCKEIHGFLSDCQQQATHTQHAKLANITIPITALMPVLAIERLKHQYPIHFYYSTVEYTLLGLGVSISQQASGAYRFERIQQFIDVWKRHIVSSGQSGETIPPYFLCGFTFFDQVVPDSFFHPAQVFVPKLQILRRNGQTSVSVNCLIDDAVNINRLVDDIKQQLQSLENIAKKTETPLHTAPSTLNKAPKVIRDVGNFEQMVKGVLPKLQSPNLHKIVLADALDVLSSRPFNIPQSLSILKNAHNDCCIFSVSNGQGPVFIGASPERLLSIKNADQQRLLLTDALAGSAPRGKNRTEDKHLGQQLWHNPKERYEHRIVVDFIVERLQTLDLKPQFQPTPQLLRLANIQHLHTPIEAVLHPQLRPLDLVKNLHPTPAVAGLPRSTASQLIQSTESFDRGLYASPIGWIDADGNSEFIVGIRSALIDHRQARLFAGAGIVAQSDPHRELAEIKLKLQALLGTLM